MNICHNCHNSERKCCGRVVARSIRGSQKDPRLLKSHISIWAMVDNGVCSVLSHLALNWFLALFVFAFFLTHAQHLPNHFTVLSSFFLLTHSSSQPQYKYNVICLMYSVILLSWQSILFCGNTIGMYLLWSVAWGHFQICCSAMETYGANYKLIMKRPSGNRLEA